MVYACGQFPAVVTSEKVTIMAVSQASSATGDPKVIVSVDDVQSIIVSGGHVISAEVSITITICMHVSDRLHVFVAIQVLVMEKLLGHAPAIVTSLNVMVGSPSHMSVAVAKPVLAGKVESSHSIVVSAGHVTVGIWE